MGTDLGWFPVSGSDLRILICFREVNIITSLCQSVTTMRPIKIFSMVTMALSTCLPLTLHLNAQNWPMVNACKERTSWAEMENALLPPLEKRMEFSLNGTASGISFFENTLFVSVGGQPNRLLAFNSLNGSERWQFDIPNSVGSVNVTPAVNDSLVLCGGQRGLGLHALDRFSGTERWFKPVGTLYSSNPIIDSDRVYIVADSLYCLDIHDGGTIWTFPGSAGITPAVDKALVYICSNRTLLAFDKLTGDRAWQIESTQRYHNSVAVDEDYVYTCHGDSIVSLEKENGSVHWACSIPDGQIPDLSPGAMAISDSFLCISIWENAEKNGQLYTFDKHTGDYRWHHTFDSMGVYSPGIANGMVYAVNWKAGSVSGFNLGTGQMVFSDDSESYLKECIIAGGKLFVGTLGKVVAFEHYGTGIHPLQTERRKSPELLRNWPNPFHQSTSFRFHLDQADVLDISVYDLTGKKVKTISAKKHEAGSHTLTWDGTNDSHQRVPSGIYMLRLTGRDRVKSIRMILLQ